MVKAVVNVMCLRELENDILIDLYVLWVVEGRFCGDRWIERDDRVVVRPTFSRYSGDFGIHSIDVTNFGQVMLKNIRTGKF